MALEAGGYAEKIGHRYEANWVAFQLMQLLEEKINWIIVEPIGNDEIGVDLVIENNRGKLEHHQCKASNGNNERWTFAQLNTAGILKNAKTQILGGSTEFHVVSPLTGINITHLCESALNSNGEPEDFIQYQVEVSKERKKDFESLCEYLELDRSDSADILKAMNFLQKFKIFPYPANSYNQDILEGKATSLFLGEPVKLINFLKNYPEDFNKLRNKITAHELLIDLQNSGFEQKIIPDDKRIASTIDNLANAFIGSIEPFLISKKLILRDELQDIIASVDDKAITLIKAEAGMGKSALLLELHNYFKDNNIISIPIRLDRREFKNNIDQFGESLGFFYSPVHAVSKFASSQRIVFILDQLDAIRWTASHSNNALEICKDFVRQIMYLRKEEKDISIVFASRDFDLHEDVSLSSWLKSIAEDLKTIPISVFNEETVKNAISSYENYSSLTEDKQKILKIPLWLGIYLSIAERIKSAPQFNNKVELIKKFWEDRLDKISEHHIAKNDAANFVDEIITSMINRGALSIAENLTPTGSHKLLEALISIGLLSKQNQEISFRHQALFDYQVGLKLFNAGSNSPAKLLLEIGDKEDQTLTKREHLKYALNMLLESSQKQFSDCVEAILFNDNIRFHLKCLIFNIINNVGFIKTPIKNLIDKILKIEEYKWRILGGSSLDNYHIIFYLIESSELSDWLNGSDDGINISIHLLGSVSKTAPEFAVKKLEYFVNGNGKRSQKIYDVLPWNIEDDSDELFELRKQLIHLGCRVNFINWKTLVKRQPLRALYFIELILERYRDYFSDSSYLPDKPNNLITDRDGWSDHDLKEVIKLSQSIPHQIIELILKYVADFFATQNHEDITHKWFHRSEYNHFNDPNSIRSGLFPLVETAAHQLQSKPNDLLELIKPYMDKTDPVMTYLIANILLNLPLEYANSVIDWLMAEPDCRFDCGNTYIEPSWILAGKLIAKFSPHCSLELFFKLEDVIYYFPPLKDIKQVKWRLECTKQSIYYDYWGETQYFLLPTLDKKRRSSKSNDLIAVLNRKFVTFTNDDFCDSSRSVGGVVTSPLPLGNKLSDKTWRKLMLKPESEFTFSGLKQIDKDTVSKTGIEEFARDLQQAVRNEPVRFASLALSLPKNIHKKYIEAIFYGLEVLDDQQIIDDYKDGWLPCSIELLEKVIHHLYDNNEESEYSLVGLLKSRANDLSENMRNILISLAKHSKNPAFNKLTVWNSEKGNSTDIASSRELSQTSINSVRGIAYNGISSIFWNDESFALENLRLIDCAINDEHPAIKMSAINLLIPILNYNEDYAHIKFLELCHKDLRITCGYGAHYFFNQGFEEKHQSQYIALVLTMLQSDFDDVRKEAAKQIYARWFFNDLFQAEIDQVLSGDKILQKGCASVVFQFLSEDKYHDKIHKVERTYQILLDSDDKEIQKLVCSIGTENYWKKPNSDALFNLFINSTAVKTCLSEFFYYLDKSPEKLSKISDMLLQLIKNITQMSDQKSVYISDSHLFSVLQKIYDEATEDEDDETLNICLDIWDELFKSDVLSVISITNKLNQ